MKENLRIFWAVIRFDWQSSLEYRSYFFFWAVVESLPFLIMFFLWTFIYSGQDTVGGFNLSQMITYYFLVYLIDRMTITYIEWNIANRIKSGQFASFLYRPMSHRVTYLASSTSQRILRALITMPVFVVGLLVFGKYFQGASAANLGLFLLSLPVAWLLNYFFAMFAGYAAFWLEKADAVIYFRWSLNFYLSGQMLPLSFYGKTLSGILNLLPFRSTFGFPIDLYLGRLSQSQIASGFAVGIFWLLAFIVIERLLYARGIKKFKAIGN